MISFDTTHKDIGFTISCNNLVNFKEEIKQIEQTGANILHFNVSDGLFHPNLDAHWAYIRYAHTISKLNIEVHLTTYNPFNHLEVALTMGANKVAIHFEATEDLEICADFIKTAGAETGLAFQPMTDINMIMHCPLVFDYYLICVNDSTDIELLKHNLLKIDGFFHQHLQENNINDIPRIILDCPSCKSNYNKDVFDIIDGIILHYSLNSL